LSYADELRNILLVYAPALLDKLDTTNYKIMSFNVGAPTSNPVTSISQTLNTITLYNELDADSNRTFVLDNGPPMTINGASMDMTVINEEIPLGNLEVWTINNSSGTSHPFHIHGEPFQVLARSDGPVPDNEKGWKDVVFVPLMWPPGSGNGWVKIIKPFNDFTDSTFTYMYHCHILEHEDAGMMGQYIVVDTATTVLPVFENSMNTTFSVYPNPATYSIQVYFQDEMNDDYTIEIKNSLGQLMIQSKEKLSFDISSLPTGLYLISIQNKNVKATLKLIIQ
jgi:bilirubin oxidase